VQERGHDRSNGRIGGRDDGPSRRLRRPDYPAHDATSAGRVCMRHSASGQCARGCCPVPGSSTLEHSNEFSGLNCHIAFIMGINHRLNLRGKFDGDRCGEAKRLRPSPPGLKPITSSEILRQDTPHKSDHRADEDLPAVFGLRTMCPPTQCPSCQRRRRISWLRGFGVSEM
jgi:hypothetical protein